MTRERAGSVQLSCPFEAELSSPRLIGHFVAFLVQLVSHSFTGRRLPCLFQLLLVDLDLDLGEVPVHPRLTTNLRSLISCGIHPVDSVAARNGMGPPEQYAIGVDVSQHVHDVQHSKNSSDVVQDHTMGESRILSHY